MRHDWEDTSAKTVAEYCKFGGEPRRKCKNCGVEQVRYTHTAWMRVTHYQWIPLVGRCHGTITKTPAAPQ